MTTIRTKLAPRAARNYTIDAGIAVEQWTPFTVDHPGDMGGGECLTEARQRGKRVDDVAHCSQPDDQDALDLHTTWWMKSALIWGSSAASPITT